MGKTPTVEPTTPQKYVDCSELWRKVCDLNWDRLLHELRGDAQVDTREFFSAWNGSQTLFRDTCISLTEHDLAVLLGASTEGTRLDLSKRQGLDDAKLFFPNGRVPKTKSGHVSKKGLDKVWILAAEMVDRYFVQSGNASKLSGLHFVFLKALMFSQPVNLPHYFLQKLRAKQDRKHSGLVLALWRAVRDTKPLQPTGPGEPINVVSPSPDQEKMFFPKDTMPPRELGPHELILTEQPQEEDVSGPREIRALRECLSPYPELLGHIYMIKVVAVALDDAADDVEVAFDDDEVASPTSGATELPALAGGLSEYPELTVSSRAWTFMVLVLCVYLTSVFFKGAAASSAVSAASLYK